MSFQHSIAMFTIYVRFENDMHHLVNLSTWKKLKNGSLFAFYFNTTHQQMWSYLCSNNKSEQQLSTSKNSIARKINDKNTYIMQSFCKNNAG